MDFDIWNNETRPVVCIDNRIESYVGWEHASLLTVGEIYTCVDVDVHSWYTFRRSERYGR